MRSLALATVGLSACSEAQILGPEPHFTPTTSTVSTTPPVTETTPPTTPEPTTSTTDPPGDFPARYLGLNAVFGWDRAAGETINPTLSGYEYSSKIAIELYTQAMVDSDYDYSLTDEYCTIELFLDPGTPSGSAAGDADPGGHISFEHSSLTQDATTNCDDARHEVVGLFDGDDPLGDVLNVPDPWAIGAGILTLPDDSWSDLGGRIYNSSVITDPPLVGDDDYWLIGFEIDPKTHEVVLSGGDGVLLTTNQMWNGTRLGTGLYFTVAPFVLDLGDEY